MTGESFGEALRQLMSERGIGVRALARAVPCDPGHISKLVHGHKRPSEGTAARLDEILGGVGRLVDLARTTAREKGPANSLGRSSPSEAGIPAPVDDWERVSELLRRSLLKQGIASTALPALDPGQGRRVVQALDILGRDHLSGVVDGLGELIEHFALSICSLPPASVYDELLTVRAYAKQMHDRAGTSPQTVHLSLASGWLSHLLAVAACDMGEHAAARLWCPDAEHRSKEARHPDLAAWSVLTRAMIAF